jgi:hypothetical protein
MFEVIRPGPAGLSPTGCCLAKPRDQAHPAEAAGVVEYRVGDLERFGIGGTRSAGVTRCRCGVIQPVQHASERADPAGLRPVVPASRVAARETADERGDRREGQAGPEGEPLSAITAGGVSFVAMLAQAG